MRGPRTTWMIVLALAALTFVGSLVVGRAFFENLSMNNDEAVYVLQAKMFATGDVTLSDSAHGDAFRPWMSGRVEGDRLVLVEQPILPALMAISDRLFGTMRVAIALVAAGAVVAMFSVTRALLRDDRTALLAAACFTLSPLVIVQSAMFVSYVLAVALAATAITFLTHGLDAALDDRRSRWWFVGAGTAEGLLLFTRPLEGIVLGLLLVLWMWLRGRDLGLMVRSGVVMGLAMLPPLAAALLYNEFTTGAPLTFALWTIGGDDSFGFGYRSIAEHATYVHVGPAESWLALRVNLRAFPHWIIGGLVSLPLLAWGAWRLWRTSRPVLWFMLAMGVAYPLAYFFYYGNYLIIAGRNFYGPHYYLALLIPSMILLGVALSDLASRRWPWITAAIVAMIVGTAIEVPDRVRANARVRDGIDAEVAAVEAAVSEPAIVLLPASADGPYVLHPRGAFRNPPGLDGPLLYAADLGARDLDLIDRFPDRSFYRFDVAATPDGDRPTVQPLQVERGGRLRVVATAPIVGGVTLGDRSVECAPTAASVAVDISPDGAEVTGCTATPTRFPLDGDSTLRISVRSSDPAASPADRVEFEYHVGPTADRRSVVTFSPARRWSPIGPDGQLRVVTEGLTAWTSSSVTTLD